MRDTFTKQKNEGLMKHIYLLISSMLCTGIAFPTPVPDFQSKGTGNLTICSTGNVGVTVGGFSYQNFKSEIGIDFDLSNRDMAYLSAKVGFDENVLFKNSPSFNIGVSGAGIQTKGKPLDHPNIFHAMVGMPMPKQINGRAYIGIFHGNKIMGGNKTGSFLGYTQYLFPKFKGKKVDFNQLALDGVYVTGKSSLAGVTFLAKYYVNSRISIQAGPKWSFNEITKTNSKWSLEKVKWLTILSIDL